MCTKLKYSSAISVAVEIRGPCLLCTLSAKFSRSRHGIEPRHGPWCDTVVFYMYMYLKVAKFRNSVPKFRTPG